MVRKERQRSSSPQLKWFSNDSPQLKQASTPLYRTRQPRYTSQHTSGHRQVVRHQLPKLTLAGSSPVARSRQNSRPKAYILWPVFRFALCRTQKQTKCGPSSPQSVYLKKFAPLRVGPGRSLAASRPHRCKKLTMAVSLRSSQTSSACRFPS